MSAHTSGEWVATPEDGTNEWGVDAGVWGIAICADMPGDGTAEANARLIAAAPGFLNTLDRIANASLGWDADDFRRAARAAIAKALGAQQ